MGRLATENMIVPWERSTNQSCITVVYMGMHLSTWVQTVVALGFQEINKEAIGLPCT